MKQWLVIAVSLLLTACSLTTPVKIPPLKTYLLMGPGPSEPLTLKKKPGKTLVLSIPRVNPWLNTSQMAYQLAPDQLAYFTQNRWAAPPAVQLQPILAEALQQAGLYRVVSLSASTTAIDQRLDLNLLAMQQLFYGPKSYYLLKLRAQLISEKTQRILASRVFTLTVPAATANPQGGVTAANAAVAALITDLVNFCRPYA